MSNESSKPSTTAYRAWMPHSIPSRSLPLVLLLSIALNTHTHTLSYSFKPFDKPWHDLYSAQCFLHEHTLLPLPLFTHRPQRQSIDRALYGRYLVAIKHFAPNPSTALCIGYRHSRVSRGNGNNSYATKERSHCAT